MPINRYNSSQLIAFGTQFGTSESITIIRNGINSGDVQFDVYALKERERLDTLAGKFYGDGRLWWVIAAASNIGWGLQAPPGTKIIVPKITDVQRLLR